MLMVLIIIGLVVLLWLALSFHLVDEGMIKLPLRAGRPFRWGSPLAARGVEQGWYFFWLGPFIRFITIEQEQRFELSFRFSTAAPRVVTAAVRIKLNFSLTAQGLPQTWQVCNSLSHQNLEMTIKNLLQPLVERIGQGLTWRQLQDDSEAFRRDVQAELNILAPLAVEEPKITEIVFSFPPSINEEIAERKTGKERRRKNREQTDEFLEFARKLGKDVNDPDQLKQAFEAWRILMKEEKPEKEEKKK
ncbi:MAG: hypothetical protein AB1465_05440 [Patescibacteria group bacterium]